LNEGFHRAEDDDNTDTEFDVRTILPECIEELHLGGEFKVYEEWERLEDTFDNPSVSTPHLTMDKTCLQRSDSDRRIGDAESRGGVWSHPLAQLFISHGY
jgi:hypothetical protein